MNGSLTALFRSSALKRQLPVMTSEQSKKLTVGDRVCFNGDHADHGTVTAINARYVTIKWKDEDQSFSGHKDMDRVDMLDARR
jgi:hypothetical protein